MPKTSFRKNSDSPRSYLGMATVFALIGTVNFPQNPLSRGNLIGTHHQRFCRKHRLIVGFMSHLWVNSDIIPPLFPNVHKIMISFKGTHFPKDVILYAVFFYVRYGVSYRDLEEIMEERGVNVDHATLNRWVIRYAPTIAAKAHSQKRNTNRSWRMDETYIKVKGKWVYLYRAVDSHGAQTA